MRYGVNLNYGPQATPESIVATARRAEELGYDSVWTSDHVLVPQELPQPFGHLYETFTTLAHLAGVTERIELGTSVLVLPQREPRPRSRPAPPSIRLRRRRAARATTFLHMQLCAYVGGSP